MDGNCISSNNYPSSYDNNEECYVDMSDVSLTVEAFATEKRYDFLDF